MHTKEYSEKTYVIAHNGADIVHAITVEPYSVLSTGQEFLEEFTDFREWQDRLAELGHDTTEVEIPPEELELDDFPLPDDIEAEAEAEAEAPAESEPPASQP
jgi:hypothetical protein